MSKAERLKEIAERLDRGTSIGWDDQVFLRKQLRELAKAAEAIASPFIGIETERERYSTLRRLLTEYKDGGVL